MDRQGLQLPITYVVLDNGGFGSTRLFERQHVAILGPGAHPGYGIPCTTVKGDDDVRGALVELWTAKGLNALVIDVGYDAGAWG